MLFRSLGGHPRLLLAQLQARVAAEERLHYLAYHDELTTLATRRGLTDHLAKRLKPGAPGPVAVIFVDVDRLKALNSFLGHAAGDQYLHTLAHRLREAMPNDQLLARLGGDEFAMLLLGMNAVDAERYIKRLQSELVRAMESRMWPVRFSIGMASYAQTPADFSTVIASADALMYEAKRCGRNQILQRVYEC